MRPPSWATHSDGLRGYRSSTSRPMQTRGCSVGRLSWKRPLWSCRRTRRRGPRVKRQTRACAYSKPRPTPHDPAARRFRTSCGVTTTKQRSTHWGSVAPLRQRWRWREESVSCRCGERRSGCRSGCVGRRGGGWGQGGLCRSGVRVRVRVRVRRQ